MISDAVKQRYQSIVASGEGDPAALARAAKQGDLAATADLGALFARAGFVEPATILDVYDAAAAGWFGDAPPPVSLTGGSGTVNPALWQPFWDFLDDETKMDAGSFTMRTADLGKFVDEGFPKRAGDASLAYPGVPDAVSQGWPERFQMSELASCPKGSLGAEFHSQIVDNNFDLEVLDRDALGLAKLRPPLDYLNVRILQCHDLWHIVGGYHTTALHEVGISAFQLSQFGHNYSAQFLAFITTKAALKQPQGAAGLLLEIILSGWRHGRRSPQLLGVVWPDLWNEPTDKVRQRLGVTAYQSHIPPDLVEQLERASA
ncbi:MAG: Coq4 family protein [Hyphomonadaceae bacterium]|nr:Coq4 family protein [Hyphomonadaceae bacterium]